MQSTHTETQFGYNRLNVCQLSVRSGDTLVMEQVECIYPFHPEFMKWTFRSLNLDTSIDANRAVSQTSMANNLDPDEMGRYELSHLDLHSLQRYTFWSIRLKERVKCMQEVNTSQCNLSYGACSMFQIIPVERRIIFTLLKTSDELFYWKLSVDAD